MPDIIGQSIADTLKQYKAGKLSLSEAVEEIKETAEFIYGNDESKS